MQTYETPNTPIFQQQNYKWDRKMLAEEQKWLKSGIWMLLYLVKHSRSDISNTDQELFKVLDRVNKAAVHEVHWMVKHGLDTKSLGLNIEPNIVQPCLF